jgi:hypothetical protein
MKKHIYTLIAALTCCYSISTAQYRISMLGDTANFAGKTIVVAGVPSSGLSAVVYCKNMGKLAISTKIKRTLDTVIFGSQNSVCWGASCYNPDSTKVYTTPGALSILPGDSGELQCDYYPNNYSGTSVYTYVAYNTSLPSDSVWIKVRFIANVSGIATIAENDLHMSAPYPNPANKSVSLNYHITAAARLTIYNSIGQSVDEVVLSSSANKANLDISGLPTGIYICKLSSEAAEPVFQKLVVSH